jgi:proline iminopeptidase
MRYDRAIVRHWPGTLKVEDRVTPEDIHFLRIFLHYLDVHFTAQNSVLRNIDRVRSIPATIVQGRFDFASGMKQAVRLSTAWPEAKITTPLGGCGYRLEPMRSAVRHAVDLLRPAS